MQGYPQQQQPYGSYNTPTPQQQQYAYSAAPGNGDYGAYYANTGASQNTAASYGVNGGYGGQYMQQQQQMMDNGYSAGNAGQWQPQDQYQQQQQQQYMSGMNNNYATASDAVASPLTNQMASTTTYANAAATDPALEHEPPSPALNATDINGLRWTWSTYPNTQRNSKHEPISVASITLPEMIIPLACMYTPLKPLETSHFVIGDPAARGQQCPNCGAFWNKHCYREEGKFWVCLSCLRRSPMPPNYSPAHPALHYDTVEYIVPSIAPTTAGEDGNTAAKNTSPTFIYIIDASLLEEELEALKQNILRSFNWLPPQSLVGFISFGARVTVWELGSASMTRCYSLRGEKQYDPNELSAMLQVTDAMPVRGRFLAPLEECEFVITTLIEDLQCDDSVTPANKRPLRATGTAVSVAVRLLELLYEKQHVKGTKPVAMPPAVKAGRLLLFTAGPCTRGPGTVVTTDKEKMMRFHRDIIDGETPFYTDAFNMYNGLQQRLSKVQASLDVFAESFDQTGILEMREAVNQTGGTFICGDTFNHTMFTTSFQRYFERFDPRVHGLEAQSGGNDSQDANFSVRSAFGVKFGVHTSVDTLVSGVLGPCLVDEEANKAKPHRAASPIEIGVGGTTNWCVSTMDEAVTYTFLFDTATIGGKKGGGDANTAGGTAEAHSSETRRRFVQFVVRFTTPHGESRVRVTSVVMPIAPSPPSVDPQYFVQYEAFDQTCAATVLARMVVSILEKHPSKWDATKRWLDTLLVNFVRRYGTFRPDAPESLRLHPCLSLFPSFLFNLRRSEYFMVLNISPDETTFKRHWLMRDPVDNCVLMIQPALYSYDIEAPQATPVPLDSCSLRPDNILLMDAYFNIHIMWGTTIFAWIQAKYQDDPEFAYFAQLLENVENDAIGLLSTRYPYPRFSRTDANGSEARHIKTRMNPTTTHHSGPAGLTGAGAAAGDRSDVIYTDEASIKKFMESLKQAVVSLGKEGNGIGSKFTGIR